MFTEKYVMVFSKMGKRRLKTPMCRKRKKTKVSIQSGRKLCKEKNLPLPQKAEETLRSTCLMMMIILIKECKL